MMKEDNSFKKRHFSSAISEIETTLAGDSLDMKNKVKQIMANEKSLRVKHVVRNGNEKKMLMTDNSIAF